MSGLVQSYVLTNGRVAPDKNIDPLTLLVGRGHNPSPTMEPEYCNVVELCNGGRITVVEIAGSLGLSIGVVRIIVSDLISNKYLTEAPNIPLAELPEADLMMEVLNGLRRHL